MMRRLILSAWLLAAAATSAQNLTTPAEAFQAGKDFANQGKGAAARQINGATAAGALPYYGTTAPETANFQRGRQMIGGAGTGKQIECQTRRAGSAFEQQECDAVNFMSRNPTSRPKFTIDRQKDPVLNVPGMVTGLPAPPPGCCDSSSPPDRDFGQAAAMMEATREAGVYGIDPDKVEIFKGYMEQCSVKVLGGATLKSCCQGAGGGAAFTNHAILGAGLKVASEAGRESLVLGSRYTYDALYQQLDSTIVDKGLGAMNSWASGLGDGVFNPQFNVYGFSFDFNLANGFEMVGFDPYSFSLSIALMLIQEWLSCEPAEQVTAMKRGQNLCVHVGTYCSRKVLGVCLEKKQRHCCFNSKLARIINRQGRAQLGLPMNSCGGFNQAQLQSLDFSRMDLSEFIADITPRDVPASTLGQRVQQTVNERVQNYYEQ